MTKVLVGMSGGVDSSVSVYLLQQQGYEVSGVTLKLFDNDDIGIEDKEKTCCSLSDVQDARSVATKLGCRHYVFNYSEWFMQDVVERFARSYEEGRTPNPCIDCNRYIKFSRMLERAKFLEFDYIATGHYAQIEKDPVTGRYLLKKGADPSKDQSYVLYTMTQEELSRTLFPLGKMKKSEIRAIAEREGFVNAKKKDSQDICFVKDGDYAGFLQNVMHIKSEPGDFVDKDGRKVGRHQGIIHYTVGQRKGLGQTFGKPVYVLSKDKEGNTVTLGKNEELFAEGMIVEDMNLISIAELAEPLKVTVKARYSMKEVGAMIYPLEKGDIKVIFDEKQRAITPGQAAVFYDGDVVVGGGTIVHAIFQEK
ncbi:tRNA 2-thiouridine(34) synthase MnmA [Aminipila luticellarii]|uniref:tRNA-specific 2-thiouridylase MnmA n=1 Tax=Aminipila luticellarii TaxID=2507160 RepID=A0A410PU00_9FIRM|nr:tRNA 2-thiouridine(34) synthase MnmA [Aminipila luticellarii]QAT42405.1 tRNA 2-thiouridine(34) synthase MnmA [Aminipila luticellarii]